MNKTFTSVSLTLMSLPFGILFLCTVTVSGQIQKERKYPIPDSINAIFQTSCMPCHGSKGGRLPGASLKFSRWAGYSAEKEKEKASLICSAVSEGLMPPESARESRPELIPTKEQIDMICNWAETLMPLNKKRK